MKTNHHITLILLALACAAALSSCTVFTPKVPFTTTPAVGEAHAKFCEGLKL